MGTDRNELGACAKLRGKMNHKIILTIVSAALAVGIIGCDLGGSGITHQEYSQQTPLHPSQITVDITGDSIVVTWLGTGEDIIQHYQVYRKILGTEKWQWLGNIKATEDNKEKYEFKDATISPGISYIYGVKATNIYGKESDMSESPVITP